MFPCLWYIRRCRGAERHYFSSHHDVHMSHYVPLENYNYYWDERTFAGDETKLRNRFKKFYDKFTQSDQSPQQYQKFKNRLTKFRANNPPLEEHLALDEFPAEGDEEVIYEAGDTVEPIVEAGEAALGLSEVGESGIGAGTALIIGGTVAAGGGLLHKAASSGVQVPFTKNVGPGNEEIDLSPTLAGADIDAGHHDIRYGLAEDDNDIREADDIAIKEFGDHRVDNPFDVTSYIGEAGLSAKKAIENQIGVQYPKGNYGL
uniref:ORF1 n=1 Tax=uncultured densovirus TaxID=748192 RepID=A0A7L7YQM0_9VIRU|nr:ORF1 [uncultured densovirus]